MSVISRLKRRIHPYRWLHYMLKHDHWRPDEMKSGRFSFSQFGEDLVVSNFFPDLTDGFYVDIGAFDPVRLSNTHLFHRRGWSGINVEPNPAQFRLFPEARPDDINLNFAVSLTRDTLPFAIEGEISRLLEGPPTGAMSDQTPGGGVEVVAVETRALSEIFEEFLPPGKSIDFLTVDCEGHDLSVLQSNDWSQEAWRPRVILAEALGGADRDIGNFLQSVGYSFHSKVGLTLIFIEEQFQGRHCPFSNP